MVCETCRFCSGKPIFGEPVGNYFDTMSTMVNKILGDQRKESDELNNGIQLVKGNILRADSSSMEYNPIEIEIHYCPFCGKKLQD